MATDEWQNHAYQLYKEVMDRERERVTKPPLQRSTSFTSDAIKKASVQWYKMKWQFTGNANSTWGEELQGYAVTNPKPPLQFQSEMFQAGKINQIRMRMFNMSRGDDASNDIRCAFLKFGDKEAEGPLDMAFSTGRVPCFTSVASLQNFLTALDGNELAMREWALTDPDYYYALVDGMRRYPKCRTQLDYYNHATYTVTTEDGRKLARFRLHGNDDVSSRLTKHEQEEAWVIRRPDMELPNDTYMQDELAKIATNHKHMTLQIQIRDIQTDDDVQAHPGKPWDDAMFQWHDLCDVTLTYHVPKIVEDRAFYNFTKLPDDIQLETPMGMDNFGGLIQIQEKVLTSTVRKKYPEGVPNKSEKTTCFLVHVETGNQLFSGTDAGVYITLYGTKGRTKRHLLDKSFHDDFERGSKESYYVTVPVIGDIKFVEVHLIGGKYTFARTWFLSNIVLMDLNTRKLFEIPCYRWVLDKVTLPTGEAMLALKEKHLDRSYLRQVYLDKQKELYKWKKEPGLMAHIDCESYNTLPLELMYSSERQLEKKKILLDVMLKLKLHKYATVFNSFDSFDDFKAMASVVKPSETSTAILESDRWRTDEEFGREVLSGVNPVLIQRCTGPIKDFPVPQDTVANLLQSGLSLHEEMQAGHVYYINYKHLYGVQRKVGEHPRFVADAHLMLYVRESGQLVPIAIQLGREPGSDNPIWTPNDSEMDWLLAKIYVKSADAHYQTIWCHLVRAHCVMEVFTVAMYRNISMNHPVYKLLIQHTRFTVAGSQMGRDILLSGEDSVFQKILSLPGHEMDLAKNCFKDFTIDDLIPPKDFCKRGVDDTTLLPNYHYRDDAMLIWKSIVENVRKILTVFYKSDSDVVEDTEIQAFVKDIRETALEKESENDVPNGVPLALTSIEELVEFASMILFHSSCYHSAMNYGQLDYFSFAPNYPSALRRAPPTRRGETTEQVIMDTLPNKADQAVAIAFSHYLSEPLSDEVYIGDFSDSHFTETTVRETIDWFGDEMEAVSHAIHTRNLDLDIPYVYLLPEDVPKAAGQ